MPHTITPQARAKMVAGARAYWAKVRKAKKTQKNAPAAAKPKAILNANVNGKVQPQVIRAAVMAAELRLQDIEWEADDLRAFLAAFDTDRGKAAS